MPKHILSVGFEIPGDDVECIPFRSDRSLLDADIIVFEPSLDCYPEHLEIGLTFALKRTSPATRLLEGIRHWRSELETALQAGKTVFVYLPKWEQVYLPDGNVVDNYSSLPVTFKKITPKKGYEIKVASDLKFLAPYWREFGEISHYEVYVEGDLKYIPLTTKTGDKAVSAVIGIGKGTLILLPSLAYDDEDFFEDSEEDELKWNSAGISFGKRLTACLVEIDKAVRSQQGRTPTPSWADAPAYRLQRESVLQEEVARVTHKIDKLEVTRQALTIELASEGTLRRLLYETGHPLEQAVLEALRILGFSAENFKEADSEFDAVFCSEEGRFLGEAEGKDNSQISIDKLSQLERNIQEDYAREEVTEFAKGVLFGNAFRLKEPSERGDFFTTKCLTGAQRAKVALVRTPDLFAVAKYVKEKSDRLFAQSCREAIFATEGAVVQFPAPP